MNTCEHHYDFIRVKAFIIEIEKILTKSTSSYKCFFLNNSDNNILRAIDKKLQGADQSHMVERTISTQINFVWPKYAYNYDD